jgi:hypothetical protein
MLEKEVVCLMGKMETAYGLLVAWFGFSGVASGTWFFASRPRLFIRVFVPRDHLWEGARPILRQPYREYRKGMRTMAAIQAGVAAIFGIVGLWMMLS